MSNKTKKLLILNLPYFISGLVCTNLGEVWRIARAQTCLKSSSAFFLPWVQPFPIRCQVCIRWIC